MILLERDHGTEEIFKVTEELMTEGRQGPLTLLFQNILPQPAASQRRKPPPPHSYTLGSILISPYEKRQR